MKGELKTVGFPISHKENEKRRALVPEHIKKMAYPHCLFFEQGYGEVLGVTDGEYIQMGCKMVDRETVLQQDVICDPKVGDADYLDRLHRGQAIFGWIHATQNKHITEAILQAGIVAYAWENMNYNGRHVFWRNNELAGEAAVMHAFQCFGKMPYETKVAVIGRGNTARGAIKVLNMLGAEVVQYDRKSEALLREEIGAYDVIVNCVLWDVKRTDHIVYKSDLQRMTRPAMIVDVSCDRGGGIETSVPTTISRPVYMLDGVMHYAVDHTPALFYKTFTWNNSALIVPYIEEFITGNCGKVLKDAIVIDKGVVVDPCINQYQKRY